MKLELKKPIQIGEAAAITHLTFREEICAGDLRGMKVNALGDPSTDDMLKIASRLCGEPDPVLAKLSLADLVEVLGLVSRFLQSGLETGPTA